MFNTDMLLMKFALSALWDSVCFVENYKSNLVTDYVKDQENII